MRETDKFSNDLFGSFDSKCTIAYLSGRQKYILVTILIAIFAMIFLLTNYIVIYMNINKENNKFIVIYQNVNKYFKDICLSEKREKIIEE